MLRTLVTLAITILAAGCSGNSSSSDSGTTTGVSTPANVSVVTPTDN